MGWVCGLWMGGASLRPEMKGKVKQKKIGKMEGKKAQKKKK